MIILVEEYPYDASLILPYLQGGIENLVGEDQKISVGYVGYYFNSNINDCVFFLPKVVMDNTDKVLGKCRPEDCIELSKSPLSPDDRKFISGLSVWIYRTIDEYRKQAVKTTTIYRQTISRVDRTHKLKDGTLLDEYLSIIDFSNRYKDFFTFIAKEKHSGFNKVNWTKTVNKCQPFFQDGRPFYINPISKRKQIDFDEELIVIFFSIVHYLNSTYGFSGHINIGYELIKDAKFRNYLNGFGKLKLMRIKHKYFSDTLLNIWNLCYVFFDSAEQIKSSQTFNDYLLVKSFELVFQAMIDELIGERGPIDELKKQDDGKVVDHIYPYESLINTDDIYYIGDSKYYKTGYNVKGESRYKQYTYAKNIIQYNLNIFLKDEIGVIPCLPYRDDLTEGYNVTPNFFISAEISNSNRSYAADNLKHRVGEDKRSRQFRNRLFDRDTLWLSHYDLNFLYVLSVYAGGSRYAKSAFKEKARKLFREKIIEVLIDNYDFYEIVNTDIKKFVNDNFREFVGKLYHFDNKLILALEKTEPDSDMIFKRLDKLGILQLYSLK